MRPRVSIVVAVAENGIIGRDNALPWHLPEDLRRFKAVTMGKPIVMGRRTFESIGRVLPGRPHLVLSRSRDIRVPGVKVVGSLEEALQAAGPVEEIAVIGGADVFKAALPLADRIYLTRVHANVEGDVRFPALEASEWREVERTEHPADERHAYPMTFSLLERRSESGAAS